MHVEIGYRKICHLVNCIQLVTMRLSSNLRTGLMTNETIGQQWVFSSKPVSSSITVRNCVDINIGLPIISATYKRVWERKGKPLEKRIHNGWMQD